MNEVGLLFLGGLLFLAIYFLIQIGNQIANKKQKKENQQH